MADPFIVHAHLRPYTVEFVPDYREPLHRHLKAGGVVICDAVVYDLYRSDLEVIVPESRCILIESAEVSKTLQTSETVMTALVQRRFRRTFPLIALGGGIVQDLVGFVATVLYRGVEWVFFPTTLLSQADSCVGSKSSLNLGEHKNLIGSFYPPTAIYIDLQFLDALPAEDVRSGIGEIMHFYLYADSPLRRRLGNEYRELLQRRGGLRPHIEESLRIKRQVVEVDEFDRGERHKFNYGHTFGHALESVTAYAIKHGLAVTVGMDLANFISMERGLLPTAVFDDLHNWLAMNFPAFHWQALDISKYVTFLAADKKNIGADLTCVLARGPGRLVLERLSLDAALTGTIGRYFRDVAPDTGA